LKLPARELVVPRPYDWNDTTFKEFPYKNYSLEVGAAGGSRSARFCFWQVQIFNYTSGKLWGTQWNETDMF